MDLIALDEKMIVSGQIAPSDLAEASAKGISTVVNNRPDGEEDGQPSSAVMEMAAREAGLDYLYLPIADTFSGDKVDALLSALETSEGLVLAYCKSGTRSTYLWALARAKWGADVEDLVFRANQTGVNIRPLLPWLRGEKG